MAQSNSGLNECIHLNDYKNIELVKKEEVIAREFYHAMQDRFLCRMEWKWVFAKEYGRKDFLGCFAGYYHRQGFGSLHLRIKNYLNTNWDWLVAVERFVKNKEEWADSVFQKELRTVRDELQQYSQSAEMKWEEINGLGSSYYSFGKLVDVPKTFDEAYSCMKKVFDFMEKCANRRF